MATGTGKTYTAFQIIWRLCKAGQEDAVALAEGVVHAADDRPVVFKRLVTRITGIGNWWGIGGASLVVSWQCGCRDQVF